MKNAYVLKQSGIENRSRELKLKKGTRLHPNDNVLKSLKMK